MRSYRLARRTVPLSAMLLAMLVGAGSCPGEPRPSFLGDVPPDRSAQLALATFTCNVTPPLGKGIYSSYQPLTTIEHPLLAKGIVLDDGGRRYVLCAIDWCELCNGTHTMFRRRMAEAAGTDASLVAVHTVHQHTAPMADADAFRLLETTENLPSHLPPAFFEEMADRVAAAVKASLDRLEPFDRIGTGRVKVERVGATRRVLGEDGTLRTRWSSCRDPELRAAAEGFFDPWLKTITFAMGDEPLARLHYYATHPQSFYGDPRASYDFPGIAREKLEAKEGVFQIYFTGCAGDVTAGKYNDGSPQAREELASRLFAGMEASIGSTQWMPATPITWRTVPVLLPPRTDGGHDEQTNRDLMADPTASAGARTGAARGVAFTLRSKEPIELSCMTIGDVHIAHLPGEAMIEYQMFTQQCRPKEFVAVAAYGDCGPAYICTQQAFAEGGYEPSASRVTPESEVVLKAGIRRLFE